MELTDDVDFDAFVLKQNFQENKGKIKCESIWFSTSKQLITSCKLNQEDSINHILFFTREEQFHKWKKKEKGIRYKLKMMITFLLSFEIIQLKNCMFTKIKQLTRLDN